MGTTCCAGRYHPDRVISNLQLSGKVSAYRFGGLIMMCAPAVPGNINHGPLSGAVDSPVDSGVA